jgi:hypothetical protein
MAQIIPFTGPMTEVMGTVSLGSDVDYFELSGFTAGANFTAEVTAGNFDTVLGFFNSIGGIIDTDDDSGAGLLSRLDPVNCPLCVVPDDGKIRLALSGFPDFPFIGDHFEPGTYQLDVLQNGGPPAAMFADSEPNDTFGTRQMIATSGEARITGTITVPPTPNLPDFFFFTGLVPGTLFRAEITTGDFDTVLGFFDDVGGIIATDDDSGAGLLSLLDGATNCAPCVVPPGGIVRLAVSGFADFGFVGDDPDVGSYTLTLTGTAALAAPEPSPLLLVGAGLAGLATALRRKKA